MSVAKAMRRSLRTFAAERKGVIIVMFALMLPVVAGAIGLGVEVGFWYKERRSLQAAADTAAVAGAHEARESSATSATITTIATASAAANGFDTVTNPPDVNNPPDSGSYTADSDAVEVILDRSVNMLFAAIVLSANTVSIRARAVATSSVLGEACVLSLNTTGVGVEVSGSGDVTFDGCQVAANSSDAAALTVSGSGDLTVDCYSVVGGISDNGGLDTDAGCDGQTNGAYIDDPYSDLTTPAYGGCDKSGNYTLNNGNSETFMHDANFETAYVICGNMTIRGDLTLEPGLYIVEGDISVNATGTLTGDGVTIILADGGQIDNFNGSADINISAPDAADGAGDWEGILFYQDRDDASTCTGNNCNVINGNTGSTMEGTMYFPNQEVRMNGGNDVDSPCLQIVAYQVSFSGSSDVNADNTACSAAGVDPIEILGPVELVE